MPENTLAGIKNSELSSLQSKFIKSMEQRTTYSGAHIHQKCIIVSDTTASLCIMKYGILSQAVMRKASQEAK